MTKLYVWDYVGGVTDAWHDGGGVLIVTNRDYADAWRERDEPEGTRADLPEPDAVYDLAGSHSESVRIFADAGCC